MNEKELLLSFWERETAVTRKVISRVPQEKSNYRPDAKSRNARDIAWLLVGAEKFLVEGLENGKLDWKEKPTPATVEEILATWDREHADLVKRLHKIATGAWERKIPFLVNGHEVMNETGYLHAWITLFDHVHHRGQLSTYLRPMGSTVPSIYGPSADEQM
ncbi:MAG TPA: DinB family protein [Acidobacteriota bacterium]|jgi:uncharacterized damage-inducible protein DinB